MSYDFTAKPNLLLSRIVEDRRVRLEAENALRVSEKGYYIARSDRRITL